MGRAEVEVAMIPRLYRSFALDSTLGAQDFLGSISHASKCICKQNAAGVYTIELETNVNDPTAADLISQRIIGVKPNPHDPVQYFEIQSTARNIDGHLTVTGVHVKEYACQLVSLGDVGAPDQLYTFTLTPTGVWNKLFDSSSPYILRYCPFSFSSDISSTADFYLGFNDPKKLGAILGGETGSMLDMYGGEFHFDNYNIVFNQRVGMTSNYALRYGQNISDASQAENCLQAYSHIMAYGNVSRNDGKQIRLYVYDPIPIPNTECTTYKVFVLDCSEAVKTEQVTTGGGGYSTVIQMMTDYALAYASANGIGKVDVSIEVTARSELDGMLSLGLYDTVKVYLDNFGIATQAKITEVEYNVLLERWEKMTVGTPRLTLTDLILNKRKWNL